MHVIACDPGKARLAQMAIVHMKEQKFISPDTSSEFAGSLLAHNNLADSYWQYSNPTPFSNIQWNLFGRAMTMQSPLGCY